MSRFGRVILSVGILVIAALAVVSCASVSVQDGTSQATQQMPGLIYVMPFGTAGGDWQVDRTGKDLADFKQNLQAMLQAAMVADLCDRLVPAVNGKSSDASLHRAAWLVRGQFVTVNQGSRLLRGAVGFGAGGTKVETHVEVYDLLSGSDKPFLTFSTTGGSGAEPGAVLGLTTDPLQLAVGAVSGVAHGLSEDTKRTARMTTAAFSDYMFHHHWIPEDKWIQPKRQEAGSIW